MRIRTKILAIMTLVIVATSIVSAIVIYQTRCRDQLKALDAQLLAMAYSARAMLPDDYHDRITGPDSVPREEFDAIVDRYNRLCVDLSLEYLWSLMVFGDQIVFTSSTSPDKDVSKHNHAGFLEVHTNPELYEKAFKTMRPVYQNSNDKWGAIRVALAPFRDVHGRSHLFGAGMRIGDVDNLLQETLWQVSSVGALILFFGVALSILVSHSLSRPVVELTRAARSIANGDLETRVAVGGSAEMVSLTESINAMRESMSEQIEGLEDSNHELREQVTERKRAEVALRESKERYQSLIDHSRGMFWSVDADFNINFVSPVSRKLLGYDPAELVGESMLTLIAPEAREEVGDLFIKRKSNELPADDGSYEIACARKNGSTFIAETQTRPIYDEHDRLIEIHGVTRDITNRKEAERALQASEERYRGVYDMAPLAFIVWDVETRVLEWNQRAEELFEWTREEALGRKIFDLIVPGSEEGHLKPVIDHLLSGVVERNVVNENVTKSGVTLTCEWNNAVLHDSDGAIVGVVSLGLDITERERAGEALRQSEALLDSIVRAAPVAIGLTRDREFTWVSQRMVEMTGFSEEELLGQSARVLYATEEEFQRVGDVKYPQILAHGYGSIDTRWRCKDGHEVDIFLQSSALDPQDLSRGVAFTALDITDRRLAEEERRGLAIRMQHTQKLESLGVLAGGIAHDFNNILMAILGNASLTLEDMSPADPSRENIVDIEKAARHAADLCKQMLAYSGKGRFVIEPLDIGEVIEDMSHLLEVTASKKAVLRYALAESLPAVEADAAQIRQVVMNLVSNASEAIGEKSGVISIHTGVTTCDHDYLSETYLDEDLEEGDYVFIEVADTGCGMDHATRERMFEPFFTTKFTGRGLGMAAVLGIIRGHRGAVKIYSEVGQGTTIKALFPCVSDAPRPIDGDRTNDTDWEGSGAVLVVDDEETVRTLAKRMLERTGFSVFLAADGVEGVNVFRNHADEIGCILLDLTMPHMDGEEAFRELRKLRDDVPIIMSSGYNEQEVTQRFVGKGLAGFIQKPYERLALLNTIRQVLGAKNS